MIKSDIEHLGTSARTGIEDLGIVKRQPDGPTNRHKNDPLVRVGYLLQETA